MKKPKTREPVKWLAAWQRWSGRWAWSAVLAQNKAGRCRLIYSWPASDLSALGPLSNAGTEALPKFGGQRTPFISLLGLDQWRVDHQTKPCPNLGLIKLIARTFPVRNWIVLFHFLNAKWNWVVNGNFQGSVWKLVQFSNMSTVMPVVNTSLQPPAVWKLARTRVNKGSLVWSWHFKSRQRNNWRADCPSCNTIVYTAKICESPYWNFTWFLFPINIKLWYL